MNPLPVIQTPPSKSITHRALICAALAQGTSLIENPLVCEDTLVMAEALEAFGVLIQKEKGRWRVTGTSWQTPSRPIDCRESGTTYRFLKAITQSLQIRCELTGKPSLLARMAGEAITSQFLSGRWLALPLTKENLSSLPEPSVSKPYVALTLEVQKKFGIDPRADMPQAYRPAALTIEGDWSSAAVLLAAGVLGRGAILEGLNAESLQGDRVIVDILKEMGAQIFWEEDRLVVKPSRLRAVNWDLSDTPDLYPIAAVLNALAKGNGRLTGTERLRFKESDRVAAMNDIWYQVPYVTSRDHRIIMAAAVLGKARGMEMKFAHPECVAKSWPGFWEAWKSF